MTTWFDHSRRAASVLLVVVFLLAIPAAAYAKFTATRPVTLSVGTDRMETPTGIDGTYRCSRSGSTEAISVTITTFTDAGPSGSTYGFGLALGSTVKDSAFSSVKRQTLDGSRGYDGARTTWTIGIQGYLNNWTSTIGTVNITCPSGASETGTF